MHVRTNSVPMPTFWKPGADDHQHLALLRIDGEQGRVADDVGAVADGNDIDARAEHVPDPVDADGVLDRRQALKGVPRLEGQVHFDQPRPAGGRQQLQLDPQAGFGGRRAGKTAQKGFGRRVHEAVFARA